MIFQNYSQAGLTMVGMQFPSQTVVYFQKLNLTDYAGGAGLGMIFNPNTGEILVSAPNMGNPPTSVILYSYNPITNKFRIVNSQICGDIQWGSMVTIDTKNNVWWSTGFNMSLKTPESQRFKLQSVDLKTGVATYYDDPCQFISLSYDAQTGFIYGMSTFNTADKHFYWRFAKFDPTNPQCIILNTWFMDWMGYPQYGVFDPSARSIYIFQNKGQPYSSVPFWSVNIDTYAMVNATVFNTTVPTYPGALFLTK